MAMEFFDWVKGAAGGLLAPDGVEVEEVGENANDGDTDDESADAANDGKPSCELKSPSGGKSETSSEGRIVMSLLSQQPAELSKLAQQ